MREISRHLKKELECVRVAKKWLKTKLDSSEKEIIETHLNQVEIDEKNIKSIIKKFDDIYGASDFAPETLNCFKSVNGILEDLKTIGFGPGSTYNGY